MLIDPPGVLSGQASFLLVRSRSFVIKLIKNVSMLNQFQVLDDSSHDPDGSVVQLQGNLVQQIMSGGFSFLLEGLTFSTSVFTGGIHVEFFRKNLYFVTGFFVSF